MSYNDEYEPSSYVMAAHNIPHLDMTLNVQDGKFELTREYFIGVAGVPLIVIIIGILAVIVFQVVLWCRCCFRSRACCAIKKDPASTVCWAIPFAICVVCTIVADQILYLGNGRLTKGAKHAVEGIENYLIPVFQSIADSSGSMIDDAYKINQFTVVNSCGLDNSTLELFSSTSNIIVASSKVLNGLAKDAPDYLKTGNDFIIQYGVKRKDQVMYIFYGFILAVSLLYATGAALRSTLFTQLNVFLSELIVIALTAIVSIEMALVVLFGDFCMDPAESVLSPFNEADLIRVTINYYVNCQGINPFQEQLDVVTNSSTVILDLVDILNQTAPLLGQQCIQGVDALGDSFDSLLGSVTDVFDEVTDCTAINNVWNEVINKAFCGDAFEGFFLVWIAQFLTSGLLFFTMCFAAILYGKFTPDKIHSAEQEAEWDNNIAMGGHHILAPEVAGDGGLEIPEAFHRNKETV